MRGRGENTRGFEWHAKVGEGCAIDVDRSTLAFCFQTVALAQKVKSCLGIVCHALASGEVGKKVCRAVGIGNASQRT